MGDLGPRAFLQGGSCPTLPDGPVLVPLRSREIQWGALLPGGPFTAYPVASALLTIGADFGAVIAMVTSWVLIGYGRAISWELPILGTDFTIWRIITCLPIPVLAGALGRFFYVRLAHRLKLDGEGARETVKS